MTENTKLLGHFLGHILYGGSGDDFPEKEKINREEMLRAAARCGVLSMVYPYLYTDIGVNNHPRDQFFTIQARNTSRNIRQRVAQKELFDNADKISTDILMLKGCWIREMYPKPDMRTMCDIDLYYDYSQQKIVFDMMKRLGYEADSEISHHSKWYSKKTAVTVEMHHSFQSVESFGSPFYDRVIEQKENYKEYRHVFHMNIKDAYAYQMTHLFRHTKSCSVSLKQLCDLYLMEKNGVAFEDIKKDLKDLSILDFSESVYRIIECYFKCRDIELTDRDNELADIFFGLSTGESFDEKALKEYEEAGSFGRLFLKKAFPKKNQMYITYPFLNRFKILLPVYYVRHIVYKTFNGEGKTFKALKKAGNDSFLLNLVMKRYK